MVESREMERELRRAGGLRGLFPAGQLGPRAGDPPAPHLFVGRPQSTELLREPGLGAGRAAGTSVSVSVSICLSLGLPQAHPSETPIPPAGPPGCVQVLPRWTKLRPSTPPRPPHLHGLSMGGAVSCISGLPVSVHPAALQLFCDSRRPGDQAQAPLQAVQARPDPASSEQPCAPLSRPHRPARDAHGLQSLQGGRCAGGWVPSPACTFSRGIRGWGLGLPKPHTGPCTGVPRTHLGAVGTRSLVPPPCLEGRPGAQGGSRLSLRAPGGSVVGPASRQARSLLLRSRPGLRSPRSFTHSAVHSFIHLLTRSITHSLIYSLTHSFTPSLPPSLCGSWTPPRCWACPSARHQKEGPGRLGRMCWEKQAQIGSLSKGPCSCGERYTDGNRASRLGNSCWGAGGPSHGVGALARRLTRLLLSSREEEMLSPEACSRNLMAPGNHRVPGKGQGWGTAPPFQL